MSSIFYRHASGRVIRRVYRSTEELSAMLASYVEGKGTADYSGKELEAMLDAKMARAERLNAALPVSARATGSVIRRATKVDRLLDNVPFIGYLNQFDPTTLTERGAEDFAERVRQAHIAYQNELKAEWFAQKKEDRITADLEKMHAKEVVMTAREQAAEPLVARLEAIAGKVKAEHFNKVAGYVESWAAGTARHKYGLAALAKQVEVLEDAVTNKRRAAYLKRGA